MVANWLLHQSYYTGSQAYEVCYSTDSLPNILFSMQHYQHGIAMHHNKLAGLYNIIYIHNERWPFAAWNMYTTVDSWLLIMHVVLEFAKV